MPHFHGTTAALADVIRAAGLVEPWPERGVSLTPDRRYAEDVAGLACLRERADRDGREREACGLIVTVDIEGLEVWPTGQHLDPSSPTSVVTVAVPPDLVVAVETFVVTLPARRSVRSASTLAAGGSRRGSSHLEGRTDACSCARHALVVRAKRLEPLRQNRVVWNERMRSRRRCGPQLRA